jgi:hypothetical protein
MRLPDWLRTTPAWVVWCAGYGLGTSVGQVVRWLAE